MRVLRLTLLLLMATPASARDIDSASGLVIAPGFHEARMHCTTCHSARYITQRRVDRNRWSYILWRSHDRLNLLRGDATADVVLDYLAEHYSTDSLTTRADRPARQVTP